MKLPTLSGRRYVSVNLHSYKIDWSHDISKPEGKVKNFLFQFWEHDLICAQFRIPGSLLRLDIFAPYKGIVIEVSPASVHSKFNPFFHQSASGYRASIKRDLQKQIWAEKYCRFKFIEIVDEDHPLTVELFKSKWGVEL